MAREYPRQAIVCVGGVVIHRHRALLIRRRREPLKGRWSIPGGMVELGEQLKAAVKRELREETGLEVEPLEVLAVLDRIVRKGRRVRYHFVIIDYACRLRRGRLTAGSDVLEARWVGREELALYGLTPKALSVVLQGFKIFRKSSRR